MPLPAGDADLDLARRADLPDVPARVATALDDWLFTQHGVMSSNHGVGAFLNALAEHGLHIVVRDEGAADAQDATRPLEDRPDVRR